MRETAVMHKRSGKLGALLLTTFMATVPALAGPTPAPPFKLDSMAGKPVSLDQYKGQVVMINFWATWCGPCRTEMPLLEKLHAKYKPMGFTMIGVNVEPDSSLAATWLASTPVSFPILFDTKSEVSKLYSVAGMPSTVIIDRKGNLRWLHRGYKAGDENEYLNQIRALVRE
jgi:thiol-disulfide isomerase/thioredoxin